MAVLTAPDEPEMMAGPRLPAPVLRVRCAGESRERTVTLSPGKCTVGSSPQCLVRLPSADVQPLQCLITLEANNASITRWASGVQLNGCDFSKARLEDGDRLTIGSWEIEFARDGASWPCTAKPTAHPPRFEPARPRIEPSVKVEPAAPKPAMPASVQPPAQPIPVQPLEQRGKAVRISTSAPRRPGDGDARAFQDRLVLELWRANYQARRRAKGLINGIRAARFQADAMAADLLAMETELDLARAAYDSHLGNDDRLQQELAELRRQEELRVASLSEEISALRRQLEFAQAALTQRTAEFEKLASEIASLPPSAASPVLALAPSEVVWQVVEPLPETEARVEQPATGWEAFAPVAEELAPAVDDATREITSPSGVQEPAIQTRVSFFEPPPVEPVLSPALPPVAVAPKAPEERPAESASVAPPLEEPARECSSTSFIDKYRHLLEEDESMSSAMLPLGQHPVIEEEFLSPAKAQTCASPADESDEALEAYMANMMRRVRSGSTSIASQAPPSVDEPATSSISHFLQSATQNGAPASSPTVADLLNSEPISFEDLKLATRKSPLASDLAALREIANSSARKAIQTHVQRRSRESAITKLIVALTAMVSAAYLMGSAPAVDKLQFWTGAATCAVGITAAIQVLILERRGRR